MRVDVAATRMGPGGCHNHPAREADGKASEVFFRSQSEAGMILGLALFRMEIEQVMELTLIAVVGVASIVAVAALADRIGIAAPMILVVVGIGLSFLPGVPRIEVSPEAILAGVLPPLLYATAVHMPAHDFRRDFKAIGELAVVLVAITTFCGGLLISRLLPGLGLAAGFALGAIISPTDAVAATAVGKRLGLPSRLLTILEGEGLVNDASSLVLLSSAIGAMTGAVVWWKIGAKFVFAVVVAIGIGLVVGWISVWVRSMLADSVLITAISFAVPFLAYVPAEELHASGVLAVVVTGLVVGHESPRYLKANDRLAEATNWATVAFLLESGLFLLMGLQLKTLLDQAGQAGLSVGTAVWVGLVASLLVIVVRMLFVVPLVAVLRHDAKQASDLGTRLDAMLDRLEETPRGKRMTDRGRERAQQHITQKKGDIHFLESENLGWPGGVVLAWSGMRGAVTVAAAQTLPASTPFRPQLLIIAFVVAGTTLLAQGLTLPALIRALNIPGDDPEADRAEWDELVSDLSAKAQAFLDDPALAQPDGTHYTVPVLDMVRESMAGRGGSGDSDSDSDAKEAVEREQVLGLMLAVLAAEQRELLSARSLGQYSTRTLARVQGALDMRQAQLQQIGTVWHR
jgi:monovalent cation/hydrogen antiporter